ncbi:MAG: flagellar hook-length control protein FliK, partial [Syntrophaceae bacterium]|nr:flagellar hook-length control protein FliK [Syntrophaceae bacterium]
MEQAIPMVSGGSAQSKALESAGPFKMSGPSSDKIKAANSKSEQDEEDTSGVVPFYQILNQQISRTNKSSDDASNIDAENTAPEKTTLQGDVKSGQQRQTLTDISKSADAFNTDQTQVSFSGLLKEAGLNNAGETEIDEAKAGDTDLQLQLNNSPAGEEPEFKRQGTEKLATAEKALQTEKTISRGTQPSADADAKIAANLTELKIENKEPDDLCPAQSAKDDSPDRSDSRLTPDEIKEFLLNKDKPGQNMNSAGAKAENKPQADAMQTIIGEAAGKMREEHKGKILAGENTNEEISLTGVNSTGSPAGAGKINNTSPDKIIDQIAGEIKETANNDGGRVKITLNPPSLGKLEMDVTVRNGKVEVVLVADNKDVQQTLNANIEKLKENLFNQGLTIDRCDVSMQDKKEEYQQNFNRQAYYQDGGSAKDGNNRQENSDKEVNSGTGTGISLQPGSALKIG